jgi:hypothetical protein
MRLTVCKLPITLRFLKLELVTSKKQTHAITVLSTDTKVENYWHLLLACFVQEKWWAEKKGYASMHNHSINR